MDVELGTLLPMFLSLLNVSDAGFPHAGHGFSVMTFGGVSVCDTPANELMMLVCSRFRFASPRPMVWLRRDS